MPNFGQPYVTNVLTNAAESANNTETVVATLSPVMTRFPGQIVALLANVILTTGTGTTAGTLRIRKDSLTGTLISPANALSQSIAASKVCQAIVTAEDTPGEGSLTYVVTYQGTGDTAVTNFTAVLFSAIIE